MLYRRLGASGLQISALSLGSWLTFANQVTDDTAETLMKTAYERGVNFFDNAEVYAQGASEQLMGSILKKMGWGRDTFIVSSKVFWGGERPTQVGLSRKHVLEACHGALRRLQVDYLDLYFCHRPDPNTPVEETVRAMSDLITQGKVLYWGTSEWSAAQITEAYEAARAYGLVPPTMEQPQYNMIFRENVEHQLLPLYERIGLGLTTFSPLCSGVLTGKYSDGIPPGTRISLDEMDWMRDKIRDEEGKAVIETTVRLSKIARELGISMPKMAVAWCLKNPHVSSVILGASKPAQLTETLEAIDLLDLLSPGVMAEIDQVLNA